MTWEIHEDAREEAANSTLHGLGAALAAVGLVLLVRSSLQQGGIERVASMAIFGGSMVLLYLCSALYHGVMVPKAKRILEIFDHSAIYLLIAGTYTPIAVLGLNGPLAWSTLAVIWSIAAAGIFMQVAFPGRFRTAMTVMYVAMSWLVVIPLGQMIQLMHPMALVLIFTGGVFYTGGVYFYYKKRFYFSHAVWHLCVMAGSAFHFFAIFLYL